MHLATVALHLGKTICCRSEIKSPIRVTLLGVLGKDHESVT
jgi:hypothetical protein